MEWHLLFLTPLLPPFKVTNTTASLSVTWWIFVQSSSDKMRVIRKHMPRRTEIRTSERHCNNKSDVPTLQNQINQILLRQGGSTGEIILAPTSGLLHAPILVLLRCQCPCYVCLDYGQLKVLD